MRYAPAILIGRLVRVLARLRKPGGGSAIPGLVVNTIAPRFLSTTLNSFRDGLVIVSGSSGKSTTTKMLVAVLEDQGVRVFTNPSTANITQGLTSSLLERATLGGVIDADLAVLEMDEGHGALIAHELSPRTVVLTNVMTDQIDRFEDSEKVAAMLAKIAQRATGTLVTNADDAMLEEIAAELGEGVKIERFGVTPEVLAASPRGLGYTRTAEDRLAEGEGTLVTSIVGRESRLLFGREEVDVVLPARGAHYAVDVATAISAAAAILGASFDLAAAAHTLSTLPPVFGRGEIVEIRGQQVEFVLVQNPASFQLNVDHLPEGLEQVLVVIGSDVRDPSYFWPVDTSRIGAATVVTGSQWSEIALQLHYQGVDVKRTEPDLGAALDSFLALPAPSSGVKTVIFSADGMRRTRSHLGLT